MSDNFVSPYAFDPTGTLPANLVVGEQQILTSVNGLDFRLIVPEFGPYFLDSLVVKIKNLDNTVRTLKPGIDYVPSHWFIAASRACAKPIYGSISIMDDTLAGALSLTYQTLGGIWSVSLTSIAEILSDTLHNPRTTSWDEVIDKPIAFPPIDHEWNLVDMVGASEVYESINGVRDAIIASQVSGLPAHVANKENPHQVTAAQVGAYSRAESDAINTETINLISQVSGSITPETKATILTKLGITVLSGSNTGDETRNSILLKLGISNITGSNTGDETSATIISKLGYTPANAANITGSNTGDETTASIKSKLGITTLSGSNTGDETAASIVSKLGYTPANASVTTAFPKRSDGTAINFIWSGQGQLAYYWGSSDGVNNYPVAPANMTVGGANYATNAGNADTLDGYHYNNLPYLSGSMTPLNVGAVAIGTMYSAVDTSGSISITAGTNYAGSSIYSGVYSRDATLPGTWKALQSSSNSYISISGPRASASALFQRIA